MIILGSERDRLISELNLPEGVRRLTRGEVVHREIASRARRLAYSTEPEDFSPTGIDIVPLWEGESSITGFYLKGGEPKFIRYDVYCLDEVVELGGTVAELVEDLVRFLDAEQSDEVRRILGVDQVLSEK
jgi:hypothetical protein